MATGAFLTNGFGIHVSDEVFTERKVVAIRFKCGLELLFNLCLLWGSLKYIQANREIAGHWYEKAHSSIYN